MVSTLEHVKRCMPDLSGLFVARIASADCFSLHKVISWFQAFAFNAACVPLHRGARAFIEAAVGAQKYDATYRLFAAARYGGALYLGAAAAWVRVPKSVMGLYKLNSADP
jgi:hypothetical protein